MAIYYVSTQRGLDTNNGTSPSTPWLTIAKSVTTAIAGDTVYIGPGTYREKPSNTTAGTSIAPIQFIGDPDVQFVIGDTKGIVRVTGCTAGTEAPTTGVVWTRTVDYVTLKNMVIDGSKDTYVIACGTNTNGRINDHIVAIGVNGIQYGINNYCFIIAGYSGFFSAINNYCVSISGYCSFTGSSINTNCLGIGGVSSYIGGTNTNCVAVGGYYGFFSSTVSGMNNTNCLGLSNDQAFYNGTNTNCLSFCANIAYTASTSGYCSVSNCRALLYATLSSGTLTGTPTTTGATMLWNINNMRKILEGFEPWMSQGAQQWGSTGASAGTTDILGRVRKMISGGIDVGAYAFSNYWQDYSNYQTTAPGVTIMLIGQKFFKIPAKANTAITVKVQTKWVSSTTLPQIILRGDSIGADQVATNTAGSGVWQQLSVTATPTKDEVLTLILYARDSTSGATSYFSDITVS